MSHYQYPFIILAKYKFYGSNVKIRRKEKIDLTYCIATYIQRKIELFVNVRSPHLAETLPNEGIFLLIYLFDDYFKEGYLKNANG